MKMDDIVNYSKQYGFIFQGSEIYGGLSNTWDYGPLGKELKENLRRAWWKKFIQENPYNYGLDAAILMNPNVWVASGHVTSFADPLMDCKKCKSRYRADKLVEDDGVEDAGGMSNEELMDYINRNYLYNGEYLFPSRKSKNKPIVASTAWRRIKAYAKELGIKYLIGCHSLRKCFARTFYENTKDLITLQKMLNHSSPQVTLIYICWDDEDQLKARKEFYF